jgi:hypothetical protein
MFIASIRYGRDGYRMHVSTAPLWALVAEEFAEGFCAFFGHALCRGIPPFGLGIGQRLLSIAARRELERWSAALTEEQVRTLFPECWLDLDD